MADRFIAIDWGTTNRRTYLIERGIVADTHRDDRGVLAMAGGDWTAEIAAIRARHGELTVLIAGMAGSNRGWREAPYIDCPASIDALSDVLSWVEPGRTAIIPGVAQRSPAPDVMRGEEVQLLGATRAGLVPLDALLCQPGTHCKWVEMKGGVIAGFTTAMTGELFALLRNHSILSTQLEGAVENGPAFRDGVQAARSGALPSLLFGARAAMLLGTRPAEESAAYVSGLLIGSDVAAHAGDGRAVHILADAALGALYTAAIGELGGTARLIDSHAAFIAGITAIGDTLP